MSSSEAANRAGDSRVVIEAQNLGKSYPIFSRPQDRLKQMLVRGRKRYYKEFWALRDVNLDIRQGETVGILGRNGAGKSTLLKMLCGTLAPTTGEFHVRGRVAALLELGTGFNPEFTGRENVYLNASVLGLSESQIEERFDEIVAFAEIGEFLDQPLKTYSSGMRVRLAFAVATHVDADVLVVDEALSVGDAYFVQKCMRFMRGFIQRGTLIFVSHDTGAIVNLCQTAILLDKGRVVARGSAKEVCERYLDDVRKATKADGDNESSESRDPGQYRKVSVEESGGDQRLAYINSTALRNDIEAFEFNSCAEDDRKTSVSMLDVYLSDRSGAPLKWIVGGEQVRLVCVFRAEARLQDLIAGFYVKDRLGQHLFGDNTYLTYSNESISAARGETVRVEYDFIMPVLPTGDFSIDIAIASGTQASHTTQLWQHDALVFKSHATSNVHGLVGIPISRISMVAGNGGEVDS